MTVTTWRYDLVAEGEGTKVTESYRHAPHKGWQKFLYDTVARRDRTGDRRCRLRTWFM